MAEARPLVSVFSADGDAAAAVSETPLPAVFTAPIRPDLVRFVHTNMNKNSRQPYAVNTVAGHQTSAESWGTGRAVSRIPRVAGGGTQRSGQGAFGNMCRGGRMFAPTRVWRKWNRKINVNQRRYAVASALAASALPALVMARGHQINQVPEMPLVLGGEFQGTKKTSKVMAMLNKVGAVEDVDKVKKSKQLRTGKGKMRNRRYTMRRGPLIIYDAADGIQFGARNIPGVDLVQVERLNLLQLAPGGHMGRFCIWTEAAFKKLDAVFGNGTEAAKLKKGYVLPHSQMTNADVDRIINSDEVQSVLRDPKRCTTVKRKKVNPLRNKKVMETLNPYVGTMRKLEQEAQAERQANRSKKVDKARKEASKAFYEKANKEGSIIF